MTENDIRKKIVEIVLDHFLWLWKISNMLKDLNSLYVCPSAF